LRPTRILALAVLTFTLALLPPPVAEAGRARAEAFTDINQMRAQAGVPPLRLNRSLNRSARAYALKMIRRQYFGHASRIQASRRFFSLGEVIGFHFGRRPQPRLIVGMWHRSATHYRALVGRRYRYVGIGKAYGRIRGRRVSVWVAHVGRR